MPIFQTTKPRELVEPCTEPLPTADKPKYFVIGAEDFERWLQGHRAKGNSYACIKHGSTYVLLEPHWAACIINQI